jgi:hypothetical protein
MSAERDETRIVRSWLEDGVTVLPDRVLDAVLDQLPATPQRRTIWLARRFPPMSNTMKIALAAAAVVVLAVIGIGVVRINTIATATSTPVPTSTATPQPLGDGPLQAGTVVAAPLGPTESMRATFSVPEGWVGFASTCVLPPDASDAQEEVGWCFLGVGSGLYSDPCHGNSGPADVPVGPTVEEFANALAEQTAYEATAPTDVSLGGYSGKHLELQLPSDVDSCENGFTPWDGSIHAQGPDNRWQVWIVDVDGERVIIVSQDYAGTSAERSAEQQAIVDSIRFQP